MALVVAHRGGPGLGTVENTLEAFLRAAEHGIPMAELDVRRTSDGVMVVYHDAHLDGIGLGDLTLAELRARAAAHGFRPPTLREVLEACKGQIRLDIELKESGYEAELLALVDECGEPGSAVLKSFDVAACEAIAALRPDLVLGLLVDADLQEFPGETLARLGAAFIGPDKSLVDRSFIEAARRAGVEVWVWTVCAEEEMRVLLDLGVDALITDEPHLAMRLVEER